VCSSDLFVTGKCSPRISAGKTDYTEISAVFPSPCSQMSVYDFKFCLDRFLPAPTQLSRKTKQTSTCLGSCARGSRVGHAVTSYLRMLPDSVSFVHCSNCQLSGSETSIQLPPVLPIIVVFFSFFRQRGTATLPARGKFNSAHCSRSLCCTP
jgi:hypothetical protein